MRDRRNVDVPSIGWSLAEAKERQSGGNGVVNMEPTHTGIHRLIYGSVPTGWKFERRMLELAMELPAARV